MNENLIDLANQAGIKFVPMVCEGVEYDYVHVDMDGSDDLEKFAELIIKECAQIAKDTQDFYNKHNDGIINTEIWTMIKHRFGVDN